MKKFVQRLLIFIPFCLTGYAVLLICLGEFAPHWVYSNLKYTRGYSDTAIRLAEAREVHNPDILVIGSSHAYRSFDPRIFSAQGYTLFNLGTSSQTPLQSAVLLQRYLKTIKPKMIIYEVYPGTFASNGTEGAADVISNDTIDEAAVTMALQVNDVVSYNTLGFAWYRQRTHTLPKHTPVLHNTDTYIKGGYVAKQLSYYTPEKHLKPLQWNIKPIQRKAFADNIAYIKKTGIPYVLVYAPIPKTFYAAHGNNVAFNHYMRSYGSYYNYNEILTLNDSLDFFDNNHMNQNGVELFNKALLKNKSIFAKK